MNLIKKFNEKLGYISGVLVLITSCILLYDVICRYVIGEPSLWAQQISAYLILCTAFLGTSYTLQVGGHVHVEILVDRLSPLPRHILRTIGFVLSGIFVAALTKACFDYAVLAGQNGWDTQGNVPLPAALLYVIMTIGSVLLLLTIIAMIVGVWKGEEDAEPEERGDESC